VRTTVDIPDHTYRQLKAKAALQGCSVKKLILRSVEVELREGGHDGSREGAALPLIKSKRPGWLRLSNKKINEILLP